ncbi:type IIL restriction-modification enzyme MmeI, partial [Marinospirillum sp.]|uniref:type IIL restriction-modification enzyme MmeI n=1 Tax=Marinospirillum sp. TaxID=2183934 RepID=UPI0025BD3CBA
MTANKDQHPPLPDAEAVSQFISRWKNATGSEKANFPPFITELCTLLNLPTPGPATDNQQDNAYVLERRVTIHNPDGSSNNGFIDLYRRGCFVLEAKQTGKNLDTPGWDKAMLAAHHQADRYVRALPAEEGKPPFIIVTDVGRSIELYSEFTRTGSTYVPFPDPGHYRILMQDLRKVDIQQRLQALWLDPDSLDPSKYAAQVTKGVSRKLAELAKSLEQDGYDVERVAHFLKRCLFTMFAEDVELLPSQSFHDLLVDLKERPDAFPHALKALWENMNSGGYSERLMQPIKRFNGGLFKNINPMPLKPEQIQLLIDAAKADWRYVEPAIFGTLLERALDPRERHKLGAHYTPRAYVERLVMPTLIEPLRQQWSTLQVVAQSLIQQGKDNKALEELQRFHLQLCETRVLDPACGSANFLYVALEHMKRLEGEVLNLISDLSHGQVGMQAQGLTVDPHQFLGMEINPRAAAIAEIVLWIGYLQWHYRIHGKLDLPEPILRDFKNIENRDALIDYDSKEHLLDDQGQTITIWDGISTKTSPVTGELIPDENQRIPVFIYHNP